MDQWLFISDKAVLHKIDLWDNLIKLPLPNAPFAVALVISFSLRSTFLSYIYIEIFKVLNFSLKATKILRLNKVKKNKIKSMGGIEHP